jgi:hypothetical protein
MKKMTKKGALMWQVIVPLIVLLFVGAVLFLFLGGIPFQETVDREACYQSVVQRSYTIAGVHPGEIIPLRCKTEQIVISSSDEEQVKREIANAMYDCWWMLGQGRLDFFPKDVLREYAVPDVGKAESSCVICSTIKFDDKTRAAMDEIEMLEYLKTTNVPTRDFTYFEYFTDQAGVDLATGFETPTVKTDEDYSILFMGIRGDSYWNVLKKDAIALGVIGGTGYMVGGTALISKSVGLVKAHPLIAAIAATVVLAGQGITTAQNNAIVAGRCNGEWQGCYNLMLIPLRAPEIAQVCQNIESIP